MSKQVKQTEENRKWLQSRKDKVKKDKKPVVLSVKATTLLGWVGVLVLAVAAYVAGVHYSDYTYEQYTQDVRTEAKQLVDQLKSQR